MTEEESCKGLIISMPPMEAGDFAAMQQNFEKLPGFQQSFVEEVAIRNCLHGQESTANHELAESISSELRNAHEVYRTKGVTARFSLENEDDNLVIRTYAEKLDSNNCSSGYWSTRWVLTPAKILRGAASAHAHNWEDSSNVQLRASREFPDESVTDAAAIVQRMTKCDKELLKDISNEDDVLSSLKQVRRILPITKSRMKWDDSAQRQVRLLNERKTA